MDDYANPTTLQAGSHVALSLVNKDTANPTVVVSWYDEKNSQLCLAYNENPTTSTTWVSKVIDYNAGLYVKSVADKDGGIHLAYYNSAGSDLKYAYLSSHTDTTPDIVMVDSFLSVGAKPTIDVVKLSENGNWVPYIGYQMNGNLGNSAAAKIAYLKSTEIKAGADNNDFYTGDWEISVVPTKNIPKDDLINIGLNKYEENWVIKAFGTGTDKKAVGFDTNEVMNVGKPSLHYANGTSYPVVAYGISTGAIEMGQKK
jgi:hypothetical protein